MRAIPILVVNGLQLESEEAITFEFLKKLKIIVGLWDFLVWNYLKHGNSVFAKLNWFCVI